MKFIRFQEIFIETLSIVEYKSIFIEIIEGIYNIEKRISMM